MERRLEKIRSWKRCSVGSSKRSARNRSLESGVMLWRLNHELFPDPGNPIARTTTPLEGRGDSGWGGLDADLAAARPWGATGDDAALSFGAACTGVVGSLPAAADSAGGAPLRLRPRPPLPRRRRRLFTSPLPPGRGWLACGSAGGISPADSGRSAAGVAWRTSVAGSGWVGSVS